MGRTVNLEKAFWASRLKGLPAAEMFKTDPMTALLSSAIAHGGTSAVDKTVTGNPLTISDIASVSPNVTLLSEAGSTTQDGTPSPSAPVEITPLAGYDWMVTIDGSETMALTGTGTAVVVTKTHPKTSEGDTIGSYLPGDGRSSGQRLTVVTSGSGATKFIFMIIDGLELDVDVYKAYLTAHPLTVWGRSVNYDATADQYYAVGIEQTDGTYIGIGTTTAIAPLYEYDTLDFVSGTVTRGTHRQALDGTEPWASSGSYFRFAVSSGNGFPQKISGQDNVLCTDFPVTGYNSNYYVAVAKTLFDSDVDTLTSYLATQSANGTPAYLVYQLVTATTETVTLSADVSTLSSATLTGTGTLTVTYKAVAE